MSLDPIISQIDASSSNLSLFKNMSKEDRIILNSTPCNDNSTGSCNAMYRSFTPSEFQSFDYGRRTKYDTSDRQDCIKWCGINLLKNTDPSDPPDTSFVERSEKYQKCVKACMIETRYDYV